MVKAVRTYLSETLGNTQESGELFQIAGHWHTGRGRHLLRSGRTPMGEMGSRKSASIAPRQAFDIKHFMGML